MCVLKRLWNEDHGFIVSSELVLIATLVVIGMIVGLQTVREAVVQELADVANAVGNINQSYSIHGIGGHHSSTAGSFFEDTPDDCDTFDNGGWGHAPMCIEVCGTDQHPHS